MKSEANLSVSRLQEIDFCDSLMHKYCFIGVVAARSKWHAKGF